MGHSSVGHGVRAIPVQDITTRVTPAGVLQCGDMVPAVQDILIQNIVVWDIASCSAMRIPRETPTTCHLAGHPRGHAGV